jgi:META domain
VRGSIASLRRVFLVFGQGRVTGSDSAQPLSGRAVVSGGTIDFGPGPGTDTAAIGIPAASELVQHVRATLHGTVCYQIEADRLIINGADADGFGVGLWLTAAPHQHRDGRDRAERGRS